MRYSCASGAACSLGDPLPISPVSRYGDEVRPLCSDSRTGHACDSWRFRCRGVAPCARRCSLVLLTGATFRSGHDRRGRHDPAPVRHNTLPNVRYAVVFQQGHGGDHETRAARQEHERLEVLAWGASRPQGGGHVRRRHAPPNETRPDPAPPRRAPGTTPATPHSSAPPPALAAADDTTPAASAGRPSRSSPDPLPLYETA